METERLNPDNRIVRHLLADEKALVLAALRELLRENKHVVYTTTNNNGVMRRISPERIHDIYCTLDIEFEGIQTFIATDKEVNGIPWDNDGNYQT